MTKARIVTGEKDSITSITFSYGGKNVILLAMAVLLILFAFIPVIRAADTCIDDANCPFGQVCGGCPKGETCGGANDTLCRAMIPGCNTCVKQAGQSQGLCGGKGTVLCTTSADCSNTPCYAGFCGDNLAGQCVDCTTSAQCVKKTFEKAAPYGEVSPWFTVAITAALIALLGAALVYVIGYAFGVEGVKRAGSAEMAQAIASLILVAMLFGTEIFEVTLIERLETTSGAITAAVYKPEAFKAAMASGGIAKVNPFDVSLGFLKKLINCGEQKFRETYSDSLFNEFLANFNLKLIVKVAVLPKLPLIAGEPLGLIPSISKSVARYEYNADELMWLMVLLYAQAAMLKFFETSLFTVFLPIGLILRSFPPTRGAGAVLVAISIGFYIVYPLVFTILYVGTPPSIDGCSVRLQTSEFNIENTCPLAVGSVPGVIGNAGDTAAQLELSLPRLESTTASLRYAAFIYMVVSLGATFIFIRSASSILGADISEIGRSMIRMM